MPEHLAKVIDFEQFHNDGTILIVEPLAHTEALTPGKPVEISRAAKFRFLPYAFNPADMGLRLRRNTDMWVHHAGQVLNAAIESDPDL